MKKTFIVIKFVSIMLVVLFVHAISTQATPIIYTVDTVNDRLVQVDTSGNITDIGALGFNVKKDVITTKGTKRRGTMDLAVLGGKLYGLQSVRGLEVVLHDINPSDGSAASAPLSLSFVSGGPILHAEGLATIGGTLKIAYTSDGGVFSDILADLSTGGIISNVDSPILGSFDFDGLGSNEAGTEMYGLDVIEFKNPTHRTDFIGPFTVPSPPAYTLITSVANADNSSVVNPNDLIRVGTDLLAIDHTGGVLHLIDLGTDTLTSSETLTGGIAGGSYSGLASLEPIPEPTTVALLGIGLVGLAGAEVRRRRKKNTVDKS